MWSNFLDPIMSLAAALRHAFSGTVEILGRPISVVQPYSILEMTNDCTAILRSEGEINGFSFLRWLK